MNTTSITALYEIWQSARQAWEDADIRADDAHESSGYEELAAEAVRLGEEESKAFRRLAAAPAQSLDGIRFKLSAACVVDDYSGGEMLGGYAIIAALADAERLSKRAA